MTDFVTMTELSTIIMPTTYTSVYISTDVIDNTLVSICAILVCRIA